jgi:hypothetical protein
MSSRTKKNLALTVLVTLILVLTALQNVQAENGELNLEAQQHWDTYKVGGTCIYGSHNLYVADVDGDGTMEILTGGYTYASANTTRGDYEAPLKIWSWNGQNVTLEKSQKWIGTIICVFAADIDGDGTVEIITSGTARNQTGNSVYALKIWHWNTRELTLVTQYNGIYANSVYVADLENDGVNEMMTIGVIQGINQTGQICIWHLSNNGLPLTKRATMENAQVTIANSVYAANLDGDDNLEIVTAGYSTKLNNSKGQVCVWQWNGENITLKASENWQQVQGYGVTSSGTVKGSTIVNSVKADDVDGDGVKEIVTGGFSYDGANVTAQITIWNCSGGRLMLEKMQGWSSNYLTEVKTVTLNDVDKDGKTEIITSGVICTKGGFQSGVSELAQLRVWSWNGKTLVLKQAQDWLTDEGVCAWNVATGDVDKDGSVEIISVGCSQFCNLCDPDMRIWSIATLNSTQLLPYISVILVGILSVIIIALAILMKYKKI